VFELYELIMGNTHTHTHREREKREKQRLKVDDLCDEGNIYE
jgi:hypothetical protein